MAGKKETMELAMIFPNEESFYKRMGMEIYENYPMSKKVYEDCKKISKIDLSQTLIYENHEKDWDETSKKVAVLTTSVAFYEVWKTIYGVKPQFFMGHGIGYLSALVCSETISLRTAINVLRGKGLNKLFIKTPTFNIVSSSDGSVGKSKDDIYKEILWCTGNTTKYNDYVSFSNNLGIDTILEIGPNNLLTNNLRNEKPDLFMSNIDVDTDNNYILENFEYKKFFNTHYCILRILGIFASTQNHNQDNSGFDESVVKSYLYVKSVIDKITSTTSGGELASVSEEVFMNCIDMLKNNFKYKKTPQQEIMQRIDMLEIETLIRLKNCFSDFFNVI